MDENYESINMTYEEAKYILCNEYDICAGGSRYAVYNDDDEYEDI